MKVKCISVRLQSLIRISDKAYKATDFQGHTDIIPASQIFGADYEVAKSEAYWISEWILEKKELTYGHKQRFFDSVTREEVPTYTVTYHKPAKINPVNGNEIPTLKSK